MSTNLTPLGVDDLLPSETDKYLQTVAKVESVFRKYNYKKIKTPTIEYLEALSAGLSDHLQKQTIKFFDEEGQVQILRPDNTTPIARLVAQRQDALPIPQRLSYLNPVFRNNPNQKNKQKELFQAGVEYLGTKGPESDAEIIEVAIHSLLELGHKDFIIEIGHNDFTENMNQEKKEALLKGDYITFGDIPEKGRENIGHPSIEKTLDILKKNNLAQYVVVNKGLVKNQDYYTGIILQGYIKGIRETVISGGRYDNLVGKFGLECPAVGFAINVNALIKPKLETLL